MSERIYDLFIVGGGVNGCGIARDAAGRGLSVFLCEQGDLAGATSSASTKLIHGGLRYLEHYEFRLVREALLEREVLLRNAPHIIWPLRFVLPHHRGLRPTLLIRIGLFLYDHLGRRSLLAGSRKVDLSLDEAGKPLKANFSVGFEFSDCCVEDSRLVMLNAVDAAGRGAIIRTGTQCVDADRDGNAWQLVLRPASGGQSYTVLARSLVNAAGPWVGSFLVDVAKRNAPSAVRLVKGSHIVVPKQFAHDRAYIFQNADQRIVFAIPYENDFTLIGTTDVDFEGDPSKPTISNDEIAYLCDAVNVYFEQQIGPRDIVHTFAGVRPLYDTHGKDAKSASRDYVLEITGQPGEAPLVNVFGGKITTFRRLAEEVLELLQPYFPTMGEAWTAAAPLPGGDFDVNQFGRTAQDLVQRFPFLHRSHAKRLVRAYGTRAKGILADAERSADLGECFGADLYAREVAYLMEHEWASTAEDVLWRRSKLGLRVDQSAIERLETWMRQNEVSHAAPAV